MDSREQWLSVKEVAWVLSVSVDTVRRRIEDELLPALRLPCSSSKRKRKYVSYRIRKSDLDDFIDRGMTI